MIYNNATLKVRDFDCHRYTGNEALMRDELDDHFFASVRDALLFFQDEDNTFVGDEVTLDVLLNNEVLQVKIALYRSRNSSFAQALILAYETLALGGA